MSHLMTRIEVARKLQICSGTVANLVQRGQLPEPTRIGKRQFFQKSDIERILTHRTPKHAKAA